MEGHIFLAFMAILVTRHLGSTLLPSMPDPRISARNPRRGLSCRALGPATPAGNLTATAE
jgi:hypothetical protein